MALGRTAAGEDAWEGDARCAVAAHASFSDGVSGSGTPKIVIRKMTAQ
jgi:hypothetical protein